MRYWICALALMGCPSQDDDPIFTDADGDGYSAVDDCNDEDAGVNPGAEEVCNDVDDNCDGETDNEATDGSTFYEDGDGDGYGTADSELVACAMPSGYSDNADDCDDESAGINPVAVEVCDDADVDENCNGVSDDADDGVDPSTQGMFWSDGDGDGYGAGDAVLSACDPSDGWVPNDTDCDDTDESVWDDCPAKDGYWVASDYQMVLTNGVQTIRCEGTIEMTITEPDISGTIFCDAGADLGALTGTLEGTYPGGDTASGEIDADGAFIPWTGTFISDDTLNGSIDTRLDVGGGTLIDVTGKFKAERVE